MPTEENTQGPGGASDVRPGPLVRIDWSTEPPALFANVFNITRFREDFALVFADLMPSGERLVQLPDGSRVMPARPVASLRIPAYAVQALLEGLVSQWNAFAEELATAGHTDVPRYQRVAAPEELGDAG